MKALASEFTHKQGLDYDDKKKTNTLNTMIIFLLTYDKRWWVLERPTIFYS